MAETDKFRRIAKSAIKEWAEVYAQMPDGAWRLHSLLLGFQHRILERQGIPFDRSRAGVETHAYTNGKVCAERIPLASLPHLERF